MTIGVLFAKYGRNQSLMAGGHDTCTHWFVCLRYQHGHIEYFVDRGHGLGIR